VFVVYVEREADDVVRLISDPQGNPHERTYESE
jgi:hypothetical protein